MMVLRRSWMLQRMLPPPPQVDCLHMCMRACMHGTAACGTRGCVARACVRARTCMRDKCVGGRAGVASMHVCVCTRARTCALGVTPVSFAEH